MNANYLRLRNKKSEERQKNVNVKEETTKESFNLSDYPLYRSYLSCMSHKLWKSLPLWMEELVEGDLFLGCSYQECM